MGGTLKDNITRCGIWLRLVFMIVMCMAYGVAEAVTFAVVVFQFAASLITGKPNDQLTRFGRNLARYFQQIIAYLTFATEEKPFPFMAWPDEPDAEAPVDQDSGQPDGAPENAADAAGDGPDADDAQGGDKPND